MKVALWILGAIVGLYLLYLLMRPTTPVIYPTASAGGGGTWANIGRLFGAAIGTGAASYASQPRQPAYLGSPGYGPASIAWQPSSQQLGASYGIQQGGPTYVVSNEDMGGGSNKGPLGSWGDLTYGEW